MKKSSENFWHASGAQKKGFPIFSPAVAFFSLWRHRKPLLFEFFLKNRHIFEKRDPKNFSSAAGFFSKKSSVDFTKILGQSGGSKNILGPPLTGYALNMGLG